ncbi:MAG: glycosyltransferase family 4 protein [Chloroflexi bacterium]|uniref:Glycosyltransferase family 4 protein n=1 Tax=Candidatus Chlorohelix allophototropha TaxID=3003348 RepID=A0A8T7M7A9_9CHLR|nr:glycosyltransferase family 4 protein [Chloroflexota bacterium]WJW69835.1 glycosyltransferase family 4 protein [Chloroflexota bacterium L227-S17]
MLIGYKYTGYQEQRNIIGKIDAVEYAQVSDFFQIITNPSLSLNQKAHREIITRLHLITRFYDFNLNRVDLIHLYNAISYGRTPWVTTFETCLPRFKNTLNCHHGNKPGYTALKNDRKIKKALQHLSGTACKKIIAISECAANIQRELLREFPDYAANIENKMVVLQPPQPLLVSRFSDKSISLEGKIKFIFVGISFFQKGGIEVVETLKQLKEQYGYKIELILISALKFDNYATKKSPEDVAKAECFIKQNLDWITYYPSLPNHEVLELMKKAHVGLLPTYADTYGYVVLEFQAAGCPVITTNIRALPEINDNSKGWIIPVPKNRLGEAIYTTEGDRLKISSAIRNGIEQAVHQIFADKSLLIAKAEKAITGIKESHHPLIFAEKMHKIYLSAV